jgi:uncharacterized protein YcaQ
LKLTLRQLRTHALLHTFAPASSLREAFERLQFVQADPIRAPARAQDLILRQRVEGYRAGDLERHYPSLDIEEGYLYAYGFLTRSLWQLRHPPDRKGLSRSEQRLLAVVEERGEAHPSDVQEAFGRRRAVNAWGGYSTLAKLMLERLHHRGLLRVARRENGVRVYAPNPVPSVVPPASKRFEALLRAVVNVLAPVSERTLRSALFRQARALGCDARAIIAAQRAAGAFEAGTLEGVTYLWPGPETRRSPPPNPDEAPRRVRLLAPFDPLVWDRQRFEQLWGWAYRFEAYTPIARRLRGYYALPLLWADRVIGWANVARSAGGLDVELGFVGARPRGSEFRRELDAEIQRMRAFLDTPAD